MRRFLVPLGLVALSIALAVILFGDPAPAPSASGTAQLTSTSTVSPAEAASAGGQLFADNCSSCHGAEAQGGQLAPNLQGVGAATVDLWVSSGWMPLAVPTSQPIRKPDKFTEQQTVEIANFIESVGGGPAIPTVDLSNASSADGFSLFSLNCAPCHTITGAGDALSNGITAPPLHGLTATQVTEALETGPGNMPRMIPGALTSSEVSDVVDYVTKDVEHSDNPGGLGLGGVGPVAEGFIGLFVGVGACMLIALWIGERTERDEPESVEHHEGDGAGAHV